MTRIWRWCHRKFVKGGLVIICVALLAWACIRDAVREMFGPEESEGD